MMTITDANCRIGWVCCFLSMVTMALTIFYLQNKLLLHSQIIFLRDA